MTSKGRCRTCGQEITFTVGNPIELGLHMIQNHSGGSVVQYSISKENQVCPAKSRPKVCPGGCRSGGGGAEDYRKRKKKLYTKGLYKTTLETWTAGVGIVQCPACKKDVKPLIRSQKNKVAYTSMGATFLLSCWPFCFMFPMMHKCSIDLYCPNCKYKLGVYDQNIGKAKPTNESIPNIKLENMHTD